MSQLQPDQLVNKLGKYLNKNIDGAYKISFKSGGTCDVYMYMYYQVGDDVRQMDLNINITTYSKNIRINLIEMTDFEKTLSSKTWKATQLEDLTKAKEIVYNWICSCISKEYSEYDFVF